MCSLEAILRLTRSPSQLDRKREQEKLERHRCSNRSSRCKFLYVCDKLHTVLSFRIRLLQRFIIIAPLTKEITTSHSGGFTSVRPLHLPGWSPHYTNTSVPKSQKVKAVVGTQLEGGLGAQPNNYDHDELKQKDADVDDDPREFVEGGGAG